MLSLPGGTEMFQFPPFAAYTYGFSVRQFRDSRIKARLTAPRDFSQSSTPFFAFQCLDIPHTPLSAWPHFSSPISGCYPLDGSTRSRPDLDIGPFRLLILYSKASIEFAKFGLRRTGQRRQLGSIVQMQLCYPTDLSKIDAPRIASPAVIRPDSGGPFIGHPASELHRSSVATR